MADRVDDHDFGGYVTVFNRKCSDGRSITPEAFAHMDGQQIPMVWQHQHKSVDNVLGHMYLEKRSKGMYAYAYFNDTDAGQKSKILVQHGDIKSLSIYADQLKHNSKQEVLHGSLTEGSLVLKGANKGALIDFVRLEHSDGSSEELSEEAVIYFDEPLEHAATKANAQEIFDSLSDDQLEVVQFMIGEALKTKPPVKHAAGDDDAEEVVEDDKDSGDDKPEENDKPESADKDDLSHQEGVTLNVFDQNKKSGVVAVRESGDVLTHEMKSAIMNDMVTGGMKFQEALKGHAEDILAHAEAGTYGITNIEMLFPDARAIDNKPEWITRRMEWVESLITATRKLPWSRIKSLSASLTHDEARAKGYVKNTMKKDQFFALTQRETTPQTVYKKQRFDRDDIIDITDFSIIDWTWPEMYFMLREEIARAMLIGDGREVDDPDKILETKIRPIAHDDTFYTDVVTIPASVTGNDMVEAVIRNRHLYKGSAPNAYMTTQVMNDMLLAKDNFGRRQYKSLSELESDLQVRKIVEVDVMEGQERDGGAILMIIVNPSDYSLGSTKGGEITKFQQFDIDWNQEKLLIEGRASGALTKHKTAQVILRGTGTLATLTAPTFVSGTGVVTIPTVTGVTYKNQVTQATLAGGDQAAIDAGTSISVVAVANTGYYFAHNSDTDWTFTRPA